MAKIIMTWKKGVSIGVDARWREKNAVAGDEYGKKIRKDRSGKIGEVHNLSTKRIRKEDKA